MYGTSLRPTPASGRARAIVCVTVAAAAAAAAPPEAEAPTLSERTPFPRFVLAVDAWHAGIVWEHG